MKPVNKVIEARRRRMAWAERLHGEIDTRELIQGYHGAVVKCPPGVAPGGEYLTKVTARALPMRFHRRSGFGG